MGSYAFRLFCTDGCTFAGPAGFGGLTGAGFGGAGFCESAWRNGFAGEAALCAATGFGRSDGFGEPILSLIVVW